MTQTLRIGLLGAARITPLALVEPCRDHARARVVAVAARDPRRAKDFAAAHGIPAIAPDYAGLLARDDVDAVYNALPASHHAPWTITALRAGKHVLCEKPFALNAQEAAEMVRVATETDRVLMEAFHYRYHPLAERLLEILRSGTLGGIEHMEGRFCVPIPERDIRYDLALGGGALMDLGCYPVHWLRTLAGEEPNVRAARAQEGPPGVDVEMDADLDFSSGATGRVRCAMHAEAGLSVELHVRGTRGEMQVRNPLAPHLGHDVSLRSADGEWHETREGHSTYRHQLDAFVAAVVDGTPPPTAGEDAVANMRVIDAIYSAAGLQPRGMTPGV